MAYRFAPSWVMTLAAIAFCTLTVSLGNWQTRRADVKLVRQAAVEQGLAAMPVAVSGAPVAAADMEWRRVTARGEYDGRHEILLDNRVHNGRPGFEVITPLKLEGGDRWLLVNRGWTPGGATRADLPKVVPTSGRVTVEGIAVVPPDKVYELGSGAPAGRVWQHLRLDRYAAWSGLALQPFVLQQTNDAGDGLVRAWPRPDLGVDKHKAYALQWYVLAALTVVLYVVLNIERK